MRMGEASMAGFAVRADGGQGLRKDRSCHRGCLMTVWSEGLEAGAPERTEQA